ncbi:MAG: cation transporter [Oscillospiraceae bacterium]|jgi:cation diffusion facilitator family transporter|nr:cation transporter [Oscillospiraceae bacterium]
MFQFILRRVLPEGSNPSHPQVRRRCGLAAGGIGVALNLTLFLGKLCAGALTGAISVTADAFNNLSDAAGSVVTLAGFRMAGRRADAEHPFGHGRAEYLAGLAVSLLILLVGVELIRESAGKILQPSEPLLTPLAAGVLIVSILVKLWMGWFNAELGKRADSAALRAAALDARADVLATSAVLGGLAVSRLTRLNLDGWLGLAVAAFILRAGWSAAKDTIDPLLGAQPDPAMVADIESLILSHPPVLGIHDLIIHDYGPGRRMMSVHAEVPAASGLVEVHHVIDHIERELEERFGLEAVIHLDPVEPEDPLTRRLLALAAQAARELDPAATIHDLRRTAEGAVSFDVVVPYDVALTDGEVRAALSKRLEELEPGAGLVIGVDRSHVL